MASARSDIPELYRQSYATTGELLRAGRPDTTTRLCGRCSRGIRGRPLYFGLPGVGRHCNPGSPPGIRNGPKESTGARRAPRFNRCSERPLPLIVSGFADTRKESSGEGFVRFLLLAIDA